MENVNLVNWFEIPATDLARAKQFYEAVLGVRLQTPNNPDMEMATFPGNDAYAGAMGCIFISDTAVPSQLGTIVYFSCGDLDTALQRVKDNGGQVLLPAQDIGENGRYAHFRDTEGNRVGLHAMQ